MNGRNEEIPMTYTNWYPGQPDGRTKQCVYLIRYQHPSKWVDVSCDMTLCFICEVDL